MNDGWIATERENTFLCPYGWDMLEDLVSVANHPEIARYMGDSFVYPYTDADARRWLDIATAEGSTQHYAVIVDGEFVGGVGYVPLEAERTGTAEMGWWLTPSAWHKGTMAVAGRALRDELFLNRGIVRIEAPVMHANPNSGRVAEKIGMTLEGVARSRYVKNGVRYDQMNYGMTKADWELGR